MSNQWKNIVFSLYVQMLEWVNVCQQWHRVAKGLHLSLGPLTEQLPEAVDGWLQNLVALSIQKGLSETHL